MRFKSWLSSLQRQIQRHTRPTRPRRRNGTFRSIAAEIQVLETRALLSGAAAAATIDLSGAYSVTTAGNNSPVLAIIVPTSPAVTAQNAFLLELKGTSPATATAIVADSTHLSINGTNVATYGNNSITFSTGAFAGQVWTKINLPANFTNVAGQPVHAAQNGSSVTFTDKNGNTSAGTWLGTNTMLAFGETLTIAKGHIVWFDGTIWSANVDLKGFASATALKPGIAVPAFVGFSEITATPTDLFVTNYLDGTGGESYVIQNGTTNVVFVDSGGNMSLGTFTDGTHAIRNDNPANVATFGGNQVMWQDGAVWTKTSNAGSSAPVMTTYTNDAGVATYAIQNGKSNVVIVDSLGTFSLGSFTSSTQATDSRYASDSATFGTGTVTWQDGMVWTKTTNPPITILGTGLTWGRLKVTSPTTMVALDGPLKGSTGTRANNSISWALAGADTGQSWSGFDADQLNALFEIGSA